MENIRTNPKRTTPEKDVTTITDQFIRRIYECSTVNPAVLTCSEAVMIMKSKLKQSLLEFNWLCRKYYDAILEDVHKKIMFAQLKAFLIAELRQVRGVICKTFLSTPKPEHFKFHDMTAHLKDKGNCLMEKKKG